MKFLCIIFDCPDGARKWHITDCYANIAILIDILNMGGQARYNIVRMNDLLLDCQRGGLYETVKQKTRTRHSRSLLPTKP